jgi:hypothetical protein
LDQLQEIAVKYLMLHWDIVLSAFPDFKAAVNNCLNSDNENSGTTIDGKFLHNLDYFSIKLKQEFIKLLVKRREEYKAKAREVQLEQDA